ncbi:MAG: ribonuclease P protein subunit [Candidatus Micrarchaeota archaeon]|nr:ribonuclease P protein subunit [Candidatus Micrarchaeota archaeon]
MQFLSRELIGKEVKITSSFCKGLCQVKGKIIDETANTFVIEYNRQRKVIPKATTVFEIDGKKVDGKVLVGRPEDRTKKFA